MLQYYICILVQLEAGGLLMFLHPAADRIRLSPPIGFVAMF